MPEVQVPPPVQKKGGSNLAIIIIIIMAALVVFGVGGYFGWKYYFKAKFTKTTSPTTETSTAFTLSQFEEMIKYPNGTLTRTDHSKAEGYTSILEMETDDSVVTANNYYLNLNSAQKWTVTAKSLESDNSRADITYEGTKDKFTAHFIIDNNGEKTEILVRIEAEDLPVGTPFSTTATTPSTTTTTSTDTTKATISTDYVISDSNSRVIAEAELTNLTPWQLKVARNEIYARYGREFVHKDLQCYFATKSWYTIDPNFSESVLSTTENKNVATIQAYEQKTSSPLQNKDSGC